MNNSTIVLCTVGVLIIIGGLFAGLPAYNRYQNIKNAENELAAQQYLKQVAIATAEAHNESAKYEADAEVTRAKGVAQANEIIANGLGGPEGYLKYLYIHMLEGSADKQIIYIPTEASLPILEAGKRQ